MTQIVAQCPNCKARFKVPNAEKFNGAKIVCRKCQTPFRIRLPQKADAEPEIVDVGADAIIEDDEESLDYPMDAEVLDTPSLDEEFAEEEMPAARPLSGRRPGQNVLKKPGKKGKSKKEAAEEPKKKKAAKKENNTTLLIAVAGVALLGIAGIGAGGFFLLKSLQGSSKFVAPKKFVAFSQPSFPLSGDFPEGWETTHGGSSGGQPAWVKSTDGRLSIEARESISGGAMGAAGIAMQQNADPQGKMEELSAVAKLHEDQKERIGLNFYDYEEGPGRKIVTAGYGEARISDFSAKDGLLKSPIRGCRATLLNSIHQFTVICKCPAGTFKSAKPMFEKVVKSMGSG